MPHKTHKARKTEQEGVRPMAIAISAREEIGLRIETLRSQAGHNRQEALYAEDRARRFNEDAAQCDALADGYAQLLNGRDPVPTINPDTPMIRAGFEKRGGYSGSRPASAMRPPARIPSGSIPGTLP